MLAGTVHNVVKYYQRPKQSSNKIQILQTKFEFGKKNEFNIPKHLSRFWYHTKDHLAKKIVFWEEQWLVGATPSTWNLGSTGPCRSKNPAAWSLCDSWASCPNFVLVRWITTSSRTDIDTGTVQKYSRQQPVHQSVHCQAEPETNALRKWQPMKPFLD